MWTLNITWVQWGKRDPAAALPARCWSGPSFMALTTPSEILDPCKLRATERVSGMTVRRQPPHALLQCGKVWKQGWDLAALVSIARNGREVFDNPYTMRCLIAWAFVTVLPLLVSHPQIPHSVAGGTTQVRAQGVGAGSSLLKMQLWVTLHSHNTSTQKTPPKACMTWGQKSVPWPQTQSS